MQNMSCKIYMDHAATTEMLPQVRKAMEPYLMEEYGNASTSYEMGRRTREALEGAREQIAMLIKAKPEEIFFVKEILTLTESWAHRKAPFWQIRPPVALTSRG